MASGVIRYNQIISIPLGILDRTWLIFRRTSRLRTASMPSTRGSITINANKAKRTVYMLDHAFEEEDDYRMYSLWMTRKAANLTAGLPLTRTPLAAASKFPSRLSDTMVPSISKVLPPLVR